MNFAALPNGVVRIDHGVMFIIDVAVHAAVLADFVAAIVEIIVKNSFPKTHDEVIASLEFLA
jgi:hypothetical protein